MVEKIIGILGGMGPEATADLYYRIIRATPVRRDQDHVRLIIYSNSKVPDRTGAILRGGPSPVPEMTMAARALERAGADFLIMPCNTAHYFIDELRAQVGIPVLNMIELTAQWVAESSPSMKRVGLIATDGTVRSGIYHDNFGKLGFEILTPAEDLQADTMSAIYDHIKTGDLETGREMLLRVAEALIDDGAQAVICGCTEVSLVLKEGDLPVPVLDPMQVIAETSVAIALGKRELPGN
jgi:aspartate racemase